jgi:succinyl-CoA synthetase alpha subunit
LTVIIDERSRVLIQGITGKVGQEFARRMLEDGTPLVAGVTPGKGGQKFDDIPVFDSVTEAVDAAKVDISLIVVPGSFVKDAAFEAMDAGIRTVVLYAEGVPTHDSIQIVNYAKLNEALIFGPNSAGIISPGKCNLSDINSKFIKAGRIGIVSRSGTLTYEVFDGIGNFGLGVSTLCCLGGDLITGATFSDILRLLERDSETDAVILVGEIGGRGEIDAADIVRTMTKKVFAYLAGISAPPGKRMGHAGAIVGDTTETAAYKLETLNNAGAHCETTVSGLIELVRSEASNW